MWQGQMLAGREAPLPDAVNGTFAPDLLNKFMQVVILIITCTDIQ